MMGKINLLYDVSWLSMGINKDGGRSGIYFAAENILIELAEHEGIYISLYAKEDLVSTIQQVFVQESRLTRFIGIEIFTSTTLSNLSAYTAFFSPFFQIPDVIRASAVEKYLLLYDVTPVLFPHYFEGVFEGWHCFLDIINSINRNDYYFAISEHTKQDFIQYIPNIDSRKITVTPLAANEYFFENKDKKVLLSISKKYNIPENIKYIFSLCSLEPRKNLITAVKAFILFIKKNNIDDLYYVLGGGAWSGFIEKLEKEVPDFNAYRNKIIRAGYVDDKDLSSLYTNAQWFVYTSEYEGFGLPPLEAMQCGCPVVTSNNSSLPEVVDVAGIMIDFDSFDQHVAAYEKYYFDEALRIDYAQKALNRSKFFSWKKCAGIMAQTILSVERYKQYKPLVSIVTITRNLLEADRRDLFIKCIESVKNQTYPHIEHIIIDGASTDGTHDLLVQYAEKGYFSFYSELDSGVYDAMNKGIKKAQGKYINFLNSDDFFHDTNGIATTVEYLEKNTADYAFSDVLVLHIDGSVGTWVADISQILYATMYCHQSLFVKTEIAKSIGGFNLRYAVSSDSDFMIKLYARKYSYVRVPFCFVTYKMGGFSAQYSKQSRIEHARSFFEHIGKNIGLTYLDCYLLWQLKFLDEKPYDFQIKLISKIPLEFNPEFLVRTLIHRWNLTHLKPVGIEPSMQAATKRGFIQKVKHMIKYFVFKNILFVQKHPSLKKKIVGVVNKFPKIKLWLRFF